MTNGFHGYNVRHHNQMLGRSRTLSTEKRNARYEAILRSYVGPKPTTLLELYNAFGTNRGHLPVSAAQSIARKVFGGSK